MTMSAAATLVPPSAQLASLAQHVQINHQAPDADVTCSTNTLGMRSTSCTLAEWLSRLKLAPPHLQPSQNIATAERQHIKSRINTHCERQAEVPVRKARVQTWVRLSCVFNKSTAVSDHTQTPPLQGDNTSSCLADAAPTCLVLQRTLFQA
jgi:hypothetical protein